MHQDTEKISTRVIEMITQKDLQMATKFKIKWLNSLAGRSTLLLSKLMSTATT